MKNNNSRSVLKCGMEVKCKSRIIRYVNFQVRNKMNIEIKLHKSNSILCELNKVFRVYQILLNRWIKEKSMSIIL